jgi:hypothetical protein
MRKIFRALVTCALPVIISACASSHVIVGQTRTPIQPDQVKVYLQPPAKYETIALLEANDMGANGFSQQSRVNKVMKRLKKEAASLGANGIVLQGMGSEYAGSVGSGFATGNGGFATGMGWSAAQMRKVGQATAIYVDPATKQATQ